MKLNEIVGKFKQLVSGDTKPGELIELYSRISEEVVSKWEAGRWGRRFFPCNRVAIRVYAPDAARAAALQQVFGGTHGMEAEIRATLERLDCEIPAGFTVQVEAVDQLPEEFAGQGYVVEYSQGEVGKRAEPVTAAAVAMPRVARLTVVHGGAEPVTLIIGGGRINLGRLSEVEVRSGGLERRNDVAFREDGSAVNASVSRRHAHVGWDGAAAAHVLYQDRRDPRVKTRVLRGGHPFEVSALGRGMRLEEGDEIHLGQAVLRYEQGAAGVGAEAVLAARQEVIGAVIGAEKTST